MRVDPVAVGVQRRRDAVVRKAALRPSCATAASAWPPPRTFASSRFAVELSSTLFWRNERVARSETSRGGRRGGTRARARRAAINRARDEPDGCRHALRSRAGSLATAACDREHRDRRARRRRRASAGSRAGRQCLVCRDDRDRREHRPGARNEDEAERRAEEEAAADSAGRKREKTASGRSSTQRSRGIEQRRRHHEEQHDRERCAGSPAAGRAGRGASVANSVKTLKLATSPAMIRSGLRPEAPPASRIGSTGRTHGEIAVTTPATKPMARRMSIRYRPSLPVIRYATGLRFVGGVFGRHRPFGRCRAPRRLCDRGRLGARPRPASGAGAGASSARRAGLAVRSPCPASPVSAACVTVPVSLGARLLLAPRRFRARATGRSSAAAGSRRSSLRPPGSSPSRSRAASSSCVERGV